MTVERYIRTIAGFFVMLSLALGLEVSPSFVNQWFLAFIVFVGLNLFQSGLTQFCLLGIILKAVGVPEKAK